MCGIAGFCGSGNGRTIEAMTRSLLHRGPDAEGFYQNQERALYLGHRRLTVLDQQGGTQPMTTGDGSLTIVFNGEIYNHRTLRDQLRTKGHLFVSDHSDTEVLLLGFREWGIRVVDHLDGMWAFAIVDHATHRLFASRDRFGKKPFYYFRTPDCFAFASELKALLQHPNAPREESSLALKKYFAYGYIPSPHTLFQGIYKLPPGHTLEIELPCGDPVTRRYWKLELSPEEAPLHTWEEQIQDRFDQAVQKRLLADVPVGVFLSGGIDSSAVAAFAHRHTTPGNLRTFSMGFEEPSFNELPYAQEAAAWIGCRNDFETLSLSTACDLLPEIISGLDEPLADSSLLPTWLLCRFTRRHVKVALGGDGGDELFAGYDPFLALHKATLYQRLVPKPVHAAIAFMASHLPVSHHNISLDFKIKRTLLGLSYPPPLWNPVWLSPLAPHALSEYFGTACPPEEIYSEAVEAWDQCAQTDVVSRTSQFFTNLYMSEGVLTKVDRASMLHGLETRAPFLDRDFVEVARRIPPRWKLRGNQTKFILKKTFEPWLPKSILYRRKKGFGTPIGAWLRTGQLAPQPEKSIHPAWVKRLLKEHQTGKADHRLFLWALWVLENWRESLSLSRTSSHP